MTARSAPGVGRKAYLLAGLITAACGRPEQTPTPSASASPPAGPSAPAGTAPAGQAPASVGPEMSGAVSMTFTGAIPFDVASLRLRLCEPTLATCPATAKEFDMALNRTTMKVETTGLPIGHWRIDLAILNPDKVAISDSTQLFTILPGKQTMPQVDFKLDHREPLALALSVPTAVIGWDYVGPKLVNTCGDCHDGTGAKDQGKKVNFKAYPVTDGAGTPTAAILNEAVRRAGLADGDASKMPPSGPGLTAHILQKIQTWIDVGMPKTAPTAAPATLLNVNVDVQELWGDELQPTVTTVALAKTATDFSASLSLVAGAKYRLTYKLLGANGALLRPTPDTRDHLLDAATLTESIDFTGL